MDTTTSTSTDTSPISGNGENTTNQSTGESTVDVTGTDTPVVSEVSTANNGESA